jgi:mannose/fructose-specific phosphotransferase system component IIA
MPLSIAVLGATGVYARHLIPRLVARGHRVRALVRRPEAAAIAAACGAELHRADVFDPESLRAGLAGCDVGINLATSLPGPSGRGDFATNDPVRREGTPICVAACRDARVSRIVQQSIAMVNAAGGDACGDEDTGDAREEIAQAVGRVDQGQGVLILTDMFGGTPCNLAMTFLTENKVEVITGVNVPILIKLSGLQERTGLLDAAREMREQGRNAIWVASDLLRAEKK